MVGRWGGAVVVVGVGGLGGNAPQLCWGVWGAAAPQLCAKEGNQTNDAKYSTNKKNKKIKHSSKYSEMR